MNEVINNYYKENYDLLVKRIAKRVGNSEDAEDVVQEAFARALQYYASFKPEKSFEKWFSVILSNCYKKLVSERYGGPVTKPFEEFLDELKSVDDRQRREVSPAQMDYLMAGRSEKDKEIIRLGFTFGYTPSEIKFLTGFHVVYIYRTIAAFNRRIEAFEEDDGGSV